MKAYVVVQLNDYMERMGESTRLSIMPSAPYGVVFDRKEAQKLCDDKTRHGVAAFVMGLYVPERTCHVVGEWKPVSQTQEARIESCSECGNEFGVSIRGGVLGLDQFVRLPKYCPECGAKVVES